MLLRRTHIIRSPRRLQRFPTGSRSFLWEPRPKIKPSSKLQSPKRILHATEILDSSCFSDSKVPTLLAFDIETNGLPGSCADPFVIELGWCLFDAEGKVLRGYPTSFLIDPTRIFEPRLPASRIHGVKLADLYRFGKPLSYVMQLFLNDFENVVGCSGEITSYQLVFDRRFLFQAFEESQLNVSTEHLKKVFTEKGICAFKEAKAALQQTVTLSAAFEQLSGLPEQTVQELKKKGHMAATDALLAGLVLLETKKRNKNTT